ncbi:hypothetical protein CE91St38_22980 [Desulfovibrionaceae bacterium]|nr:hypothetical protein CE91St38_22980 [Desulfovibrionaceae bacterium]GKI12840.1 hypothetical protein CE91St39_22940 [Desulfovibrionaceae bacterium]
MVDSAVLRASARASSGLKAGFLAILLLLQVKDISSIGMADATKTHKKAVALRPEGAPQRHHVPHAA